MRWIIGFIDKWVSIFFLLIILIVAVIVIECNDETVKTEVKAESFYNNINTNGNINLKPKTAFIHPPTGFSIGFDYVPVSIFNVTYPNGNTGMEILEIGQGLRFKDESKTKEYEIKFVSSNEEEEYITMNIRQIK